MNFEQYQKLRDFALANCVQDGQEYPVPSQLNAIVLAYIGDVVFSTYVRLRILPNSNQVRVLHDLSAKMVSAVCQAKAMKNLVGELKADELEIYHRGRNTKSMVPKSATVQEYREATALEALLGYLFLSKAENRCEEIMEKVFQNIVMQLKK
ncbi:MAG: ribonuclease III [Phascolarctobacterium sp.]|nr:ribonuclease III [Candidatus Phascolarctobacterium caballi]